jgi:hypothetical protein
VEGGFLVHSRRRRGLSGPFKAALEKSLRRKEAFWSIDGVGGVVEAEGGFLVHRRRRRRLSGSGSFKAAPEESLRRKGAFWSIQGGVGGVVEAEGGFLVHRRRRRSLSYSLVGLAWWDEEKGENGAST